MAAMIHLAASIRDLLGPASGATVRDIVTQQRITLSGLTATPERADGQEILLSELIGPIVYRKEIKQLAGDYLAEYRTEKLYVELSAEEQARYRQAREIYRNFVEARGISMGGPQSWQRFIIESSRSPEGRGGDLGGTGAHRPNLLTTSSTAPITSPTSLSLSKGWSGRLNIRW
jgi:superfamily II DNA or RNA helicase